MQTLAYLLLCSDAFLPIKQETKLYLFGLLILSDIPGGKLWFCPRFLILYAQSEMLPAFYHVQLYISRKVFHQSVKVYVTIAISIKGSCGSRADLIETFKVFQRDSGKQHEHIYMYSYFVLLTTTPWASTEQATQPVTTHITNRPQCHVRFSWTSFIFFFKMHRCHKS